MKGLSVISYIKFVFISALLFSSCSQVDTLFEIPATLDMTIEAGSNTFEVLVFRSDPVLFPFDLSLETRGIDPLMVDKVIANTALFRPVFNSTDLNFINEIVIQVVDPDDTTNVREVFFADPVPLGPKNEIELNASLPDIQEFIIDGDMVMFLVEVRFRSIPAVNVDIRIDMEFSVTAAE